MADTSWSGFGGAATCSMPGIQTPSAGTAATAGQQEVLQQQSQGSSAGASSSSVTVDGQSTPGAQASGGDTTQTPSAGTAATAGQQGYNRIGIIPLKGAK